MAALALSFRDTLEAALIIGLALATLVRLGQARLIQTLWLGVGAGALLGFSIGTGLIAGGLAATGSVWTVVEVTMMALSVAAFGGLLLTGRRFSPESGPAQWLAVAVGLLATLPQTLDLMNNMANNAGGLASLAVSSLGVALAFGLAAAISLGLIRMKPGQRGNTSAEEPTASVTGELAPVRQRVD